MSDLDLERIDESERWPRPEDPFVLFATGWPKREASRGQRRQRDGAWGHRRCRRHGRRCGWWAAQGGSRRAGRPIRGGSPSSTPIWESNKGRDARRQSERPRCASTGKKAPLPPARSGCAGPVVAGVADAEADALLRQPAARVPHRRLGIDPVAPAGRAGRVDPPGRPDPAAKYASRPGVPRPPHWSGFRIVPAANRMFLARIGPSPPA